MPARKCVWQLCGVLSLVSLAGGSIGRTVGRLVGYKCMKSLLNVYLSVSNRVFSISFALSSWRLFRTQQTFYVTFLCHFFFSVHYFFFIALTFFRSHSHVCALSLNWFDIVIFHPSNVFIWFILWEQQCCRQMATVAAKSLNFYGFYLSALLLLLQIRLGFKYHPIYWKHFVNSQN